MKFFCAYHSVAPRFDLLETVGAAIKAKGPVPRLSTGQQRRLALALAVAHEPQVLFLDEPTAGLDVASRVELHDLMRELQATGTTIILATHDMAEAEEMSDRVAILLKGKTSDHRHAHGDHRHRRWADQGICPYTRIPVLVQNRGITFPAVSQQVQKMSMNIYFSTDIGPTVSAIIANLEAQEDPLIDLRVERPSLEDRFLEITSSRSCRKWRCTMTAFLNHFSFEFRTGIRNRTLLLMNYLFPLGFYLMMGFVMRAINPTFLDSMTPAMVVFAI